jgi:hypothetical protein
MTKILTQKKTSKSDLFPEKKPLLAVGSYTNDSGPPKHAPGSLQLA